MIVCWYESASSDTTTGGRVKIECIVRMVDDPEINSPMQIHIKQWYILNDPAMFVYISTAQKHFYLEQTYIDNLGKTNANSCEL